MALFSSKSFHLISAGPQKPQKLTTLKINYTEFGMSGNNFKGEMVVPLIFVQFWTRSRISLMFFCLFTTLIWNAKNSFPPSTLSRVFTRSVFDLLDWELNLRGTNPSWRGTREPERQVSHSSPHSTIVCPIRNIYFILELAPPHVLWQVSFGFWVTWSISSWQEHYKNFFFPRSSDQ